MSENNENYFDVYGQENSVNDNLDQSNMENHNGDTNGNSNGGAQVETGEAMSDDRVREKIRSSHSVTFNV